jgi:hypothetical protein
VYDSLLLRNRTIELLYDWGRRTSYSQPWNFNLNLILFCYRGGGNTIPIIHNCVTPSDYSLRGNMLGDEGGKAIAEALKVNQTIDRITYVAPPRVCAHSRLLPPEGVTQIGMLLPPR